MIFRGRARFVYCEAFVVARYEYGVSSQPASGVPFSAAPSSPRSLVALGDLPEEEVGLGADARVEYARRCSNRSAEVLDDLGERVLARPARSSTGSRRHAGSTRKNV